MWRRATRARSTVCREASSRRLEGAEVWARLRWGAEHTDGEPGYDCGLYLHVDQQHDGWMGSARVRSRLEVGRHVWAAEVGAASAWTEPDRRDAIGPQPTPRGDGSTASGDPSSGAYRAA